MRKLNLGAIRWAESRLARFGCFIRFTAALQQAQQMANGLYVDLRYVSGATRGSDRHQSTQQQNQGTGEQQWREETENWR